MIIRMVIGTFALVKRRRRPPFHIQDSLSVANPSTIHSVKCMASMELASAGGWTHRQSSVSKTVQIRVQLTPSILRSLTPSKIHVKLANMSTERLSCHGRSSKKFRDTNCPLDYRLFICQLRNLLINLSPSVSALTPCQLGSADFQ